MAKTSVINIRTEEKTKKQIEYLFSQFGISVSDAVNIFFHKALMEGGLPFNVQLSTPNAETLEAMNDVDNKLNMSESFDNMSDLMRELNA